MDEPTKLSNHERFVAGNQELRDILRRAEGLEKVAGRMNKENLKIIETHLMNLTPQVGDASRGGTLDAGVQDEVAEYVKNFRALQIVIKKIRCAPSDRRAQSKTPERQFDEPQETEAADLQNV